jgi:hypothetical protein
VHGIVTGQTTRPGWVLDRAVRQKGVFHKLQPPPLGSALTIGISFQEGESLRLSRAPNTSCRCTRPGCRCTASR